MFYVVTIYVCVGENKRGKKRNWVERYDKQDGLGFGGRGLIRCFYILLVKLGSLLLQLFLLTSFTFPYFRCLL